MLNSIIVPTFNRARLLPRAIKSVINQTHREWELLIVDDASTDDTQGVVESFRDERIRYLRLPQNAGVSTARNHGIRKATGDRISFLDSDDQFLPTFLAETNKALDETGPGIGFSWAGTIRVSETAFNGVHRKHVSRTLWLPSYSTTQQAYLACLRWDPVWGTGHGVTVLRDVLEATGGFDARLPAREDIDLLLRLMKVTRFVVVRKFLVRVHSDAVVRLDANHLNQAEAYRVIYEKHAASIERDKQAFVFFNSYIGRQYAEAGRLLPATRYVARALLRYPRQGELWKAMVKNWAAVMLRSTKTPK